MSKRKCIVLVVTAVCILLLYVFLPLPHGLRYVSQMSSDRQTAGIATAINVYAVKGKRGIVGYQSGSFENVSYQVLMVKPNDGARVQVDYSEDGLKQLKDLENPDHGYVRVGGINGGFFEAHGENQGRPVGGVLIRGSWAKWHGQDLAPAYGEGNVTIYFDQSGESDLFYHGWRMGQWEPFYDSMWHYDQKTDQYAYDLRWEYGISGAYALLKKGRKCYLGKNDSMYFERSKDSGVTLFGIRKDGTFLLVTAGALGGGEKEAQLMRQLGAYNAIRMDGNSSTAMCVDFHLVRKVK